MILPSWNLVGTFLDDTKDEGCCAILIWKSLKTWWGVSEHVVLREDVTVARCIRSRGAWDATKSQLTVQAVLRDGGRILDNAEDARQCIREYWSKIFRAREDIAHEVKPEDVLRHVVRALEDIVWTMSEADFCTL